MWTTTHVQRHGIVRRRISTPVNSERKWKRRRRRNEQGIRIECCQKTGRVRALRPYQTVNIRRQMARRQPAQCRWLLQELQLRALENYRQDGNKDILRKDVLISLITTPEQPHGLTQGGSSTSGCTAITPITRPSSNSLSHNLALYLVDGKCDSPIPHEYTLWTTTLKPPPGTTRDCHHHLIKTFLSTRETLGENLSTLDLSRLSVYCLVSATSRSADLTFSRTRTRRLCVKARTI